MVYVAVHALSLCGLVVALYLPGRLAGRAAGASLVSPAYPGLTRFVLGIAFWLAVLFGISAAGLLSSAAIWIVIAILLLAQFAVRRRSPEFLRAVPGATQLLREWQVWVPMAAVIFVLGVSFLEGLRPTPAWDANTYHLTLPRLYLEHGGFRAVSFNIFSNWPLNTELLFMLAMALHDYLLATHVQLLFTVLIVAAILRQCGLRGSIVMGGVAACLFLANDVVLFEAGVAYVDMALTFFFVMAVWMLLEVPRNPERRRQHLLLVGVCCGLMAGVKLTGLFGLASILPLLLWDGWRERRFWSRAREALLYVVLPALLIVLPWYAKSAWYTGNPVYPFFYDALRGVEWNRRLESQLLAWQYSIGMGRSLHDYLLLPLRVILNGAPGYERFDGRVSPLWIAIVPIVVAGSWKDPTVRRLGTVALLYFCGWAVSSQQTRFLIPILPLLAVAAVLTVWRLVGIVERAAVRSAIAAALAVAAAIYLAVAAGPTIADSRDWLRQYRSEGEHVLQAAVPPVFRVINSELPANARLLFLNTNQGFFSARAYLSDSVFEASQINTLLFRNRRVQEIRLELAARGITHILVSRARWGIPYPPALDDLLGSSRVI